MDKDQKKYTESHPSDLKVALVAIMFAATVLLLLSAWVHSCGKIKRGDPEAAPPPTATQKCDEDGIIFGSVEDLGCQPGEQGKHTQVCTEQGWAELDNTCQPSGTPQKPDCSAVVTFDELAPIIGLNCVSCHVGFDQLAKAKEKSAEMLRRIQLPQDQTGHMPAQRAPLSTRDIAIFKKWASDGFLAPADCLANVPPPGHTFVDFASIEQTMFADINRVSPADQPVMRYLISPDQLNMGTPESLAIMRKAAVKAANSVSVERTIRDLVDVAPGIWRVNIDDLGIEQPDWLALEAGSQLQFESFTQTGVALKNVTRTRLPWMNIADFNDTALRNAGVYYRLTEAPYTLRQLTEKLGVNFSGDLGNFKAALIGFNGSSLSPAANRLMSRHQSSDGFFWATYDTGPIVSAQQNIFKNPLLAEAGGVANLKFAAGEQLYTLPNGMIASFLAAADGRRLDQADPAVVHDFTTNPVSPIIKNAISCFRCHSGGLIHAVDQIRAASSSAGIGAADTQRVLALFKPQGEIDRLFQDDNKRFGQALAQLKIDSTQPDPISQVSDRFLGDLSLEYVSGILVLRPEDLKICISLSNEGKQQAGQLLTGGTISHDQFVQVAKVLLRDCRIFQDPLSQ